MSRRLVIAISLVCAACSADPGDDGALGNDGFGEETTGITAGGQTTGISGGSAQTTGDSGTDGDSSAGGDSETAGGDTDDAGSTGVADSDTGFDGGPGLYVREDGADSNPGTEAEPMRTIQWALAEAESQGLQAVYVAEGTYVATHDNNEAIELRGGVSLYGGFSSNDWEDRDPEVYETRIVDDSIGTSGISQDAPHRAIYVPVGVDDDTVVDGFTIAAADASYAAAVFVEGGSATFTGNQMLGRTGATTSMAVRILGGRPVFENNTLDAVGSSSSSYGVNCTDAQPEFVGNDILSGESSTPYAMYYQTCEGTIANNVIRGERPTSSTGHGLYLYSSSPDVLANTIAVEPRSSSTSYHMRLATSSVPTVENNNFVEVTSVGTTYCVYAYSNGDPASLRNNNLQCTYLFYGSTTYSTLLELETNVASAESNVAADPGVVDPLGGDLSLSPDGTVLCSVARGGLDLSGTLPERDRAGESRTAPWSIGAFELDGNCQ